MQKVVCCSSWALLKGGKSLALQPRARARSVSLDEANDTHTVPKVLMTVSRRGVASWQLRSCNSVVLAFFSCPVRPCPLKYQSLGKLAFLKAPQGRPIGHELSPIHGVTGGA